mmetsp:Transcript_9586/g.31913  ORF Transcript_9586/g.31913 Transcript_9586/m.31913 type:complete len:262 (+) Transcript_9586:645-1430(+)
MAAMTCSMGVMPVPPAIIPSRLQASSLLPLLNRPAPRYSCIPIGPWMSIVSPTLSESMYCDILPPSGKRSITPPLYTLITRSTYPTSSSDVVGVYLRSISFSPSSGSSRPFHRPSTTPFGAGAKSLKCLPTGRPSTGVASGSTKRNRTVSCEMLVRSPSVTVCRDLLRNLAPRGLPPPPRIETRKTMERTTMTAATRTAGSIVFWLLPPFPPPPPPRHRVGGVRVARPRRAGCRGGARHREGARDQAGGADRRHLHRTRPA